MNTDYSEYILSPKEKYRFLAIGYICTFAVVYLFYHSMWLSLVSGILPCFVTKSYSSFLAEKRRSFLLTQFKDMLYSVSASVASGRQLGEALKEARDALGAMYEEDTPLLKELTAIVRNMKENNENEYKLLLRFAQRSHCEDIKNFAEVCMICGQTGGDLLKAVKNTSDVLADKMEIEREIKAFTAQKKMEGKIITVMPAAVILFLDLFSPDYLDVLYTTLAGRFIMTMALAGICSAYYITDRLLKIEV